MFKFQPHWSPRAFSRDHMGSLIVRLSNPGIKLHKICDRKAKKTGVKGSS